MLEKIERVLTRYNMLRPGDRVGVAVSGGPDSVCLLAILRELAPRYGISLAVVHLNHQLRGEHSDADEHFVAHLAQTYGLPLHSTSRAVGLSENDGRQARRAFFAELQAAGHVHRLATGHTQDDQAETVLFRLLRGASPSGLSGILPVTREGVIRPLLDVTRAEVVAYLRHHGLIWRVDASNADPRYARNRLRHHLLPTLVRDWNPHLAAQLARTAAIARDEDLFLDELVPAPLTDGHAVLLPTTPLATALRRRQLRWIAHHLGSAADFRHIEALENLFAPGLGSARLQIPGLDALRSYDWVRFAPLAAASNRNWSQPLPLPGTVHLSHGSITVSLGTIEGDCFDGDVAGAGLTLRNWRPGDAYSPVGPLKERFEAERIPLWERRNWPIIARDSEIVWARQFGVADRFQIGSGSRNCYVRWTPAALVPLSRPVMSPGSENNVPS